jgi:hypothetical protein
MWCLLSLFCFYMYFISLVSGNKLRCGKLVCRYVRGREKCCSNLYPDVSRSIDRRVALRLYVKNQDTTGKMFCPKVLMGICDTMVSRMRQTLAVWHMVCPLNLWSGSAACVRCICFLHIYVRSSSLLFCRSVWCLGGIYDWLCSRLFSPCILIVATLLKSSEQRAAKTLENISFHTFFMYLKIDYWVMFEAFHCSFLVWPTYPAKK